MIYDYAIEQVREKKEDVDDDIKSKWGINNVSAQSKLVYIAFYQHLAQNIDH
jgi:hypothetical protein